MSRHRSYAVVRTIVLALTAVACKPERKATLQGDVYLVMQNGDVKRGAGQDVHLLALPDSFQRSVATACSTYARAVAARQAQRRQIVDRPRDALQRWRHFQQLAAGESNGDRHMLLVDSADKYRREYDRLNAGVPDPGPDTTANDRLLRSLYLLLAASEAANTKTRLDAHYRFDGVKPGNYVLWAAWPIADHFYQFWAPAIVSRDSTVRDLDNSVAADNRLFCWKLAPTDPP